MKVVFLLLFVLIFRVVESMREYGGQDYGYNGYGGKANNGVRDRNIISPGNIENGDLTNGSVDNGGNTRNDNNGGNTLVDNNGGNTRNENNGGNTRNDNNGGNTWDNNGGNTRNDNNGGNTQSDNNTADTATGDMTDDGNMTIDDLFPNGGDGDITPVDIDGEVNIDDVFGNIIGTDGNVLQTTPAWNSDSQNPRQSDSPGMKDRKRHNNKNQIHKKDNYKRKDKKYGVISNKYHYKKSVICQPGFFLRFRKCRPCPRGFFQPRPNQKFCKRCPRGTTTRMEGTRDRCQCFDPREKVGCVKKCRGLPPGDYPSCLGCNFYASCIGGYYIIDGRKCPAYLEWDDNCKRCEYKSNTCRHHKNKYSRKYERSRKSGYSKKPKYYKP